MISIIIGIPTLVAVIGWLIYRSLWVTSIESYELAFSRDRATGKIEVIDHSGNTTRNPLYYKVHKIDLRPVQVTLTANGYILAAKVVSFDPTGLTSFVQLYGCDTGDSTDNVTEILRYHAFTLNGVKGPPFLRVHSELITVQPRRANYVALFYFINSIGF